MNIESVNLCYSRKKNSIMPKAAIASLLLFIPCGDVAKQDKPFLEQQPKTDICELSKNIIDLKADGSYTVVDTNKTEKTEVLASNPVTEKVSDKKAEKEKGGVSLFSYLFLLGNYIIVSGLWIKAIHEKRNKDKIIDELYNGNKKIYNMARETLEKAKEDIDFLIERNKELEIKNKELKNENTYLKYLVFNK